MPSTRLSPQSNRCEAPNPDRTHHRHQHQFLPMSLFNESFVTKPIYKHSAQAQNKPLPIPNFEGTFHAALKRGA